MLYLVLVLILIGGWQAFMRGSMSQMISGVSLWGAFILLVIGLITKRIDVQIVLFGVFVLVSIFLLMQLYRFSTYHKYFPKIAPLLIGYGFLVSYLLAFFGFSKYFIWYLVFTIGFLVVNFKKQNDIKRLFPTSESGEQKRLLENSFKNTIKFHLLSSVFYIIAVVISFLYF